jgi:hypothetical protein
VCQQTCPPNFPSPERTPVLTHRFRVATPNGSLPPQRKVCHQTTEKRHQSDMDLPRIIYARGEARRTS